VTLTETTAWRAQAACRGMPPELFVPEPPDSTTTKEEREEYVQRVAVACGVCEGCPVRTECWWYGYENGLPGIWGGQLFDRKWWGGYPNIDIEQFLAMRDGQPEPFQRRRSQTRWQDGPAPRMDTWPRSELVSIRGATTRAEEPELRRLRPLHPGRL
jgi:hypothetical protein